MMLPIPLFCASFDGNDVFDDGSKNTQLWGDDQIQGIGQLSETAGNLRYSAAGAAQVGDFAGRPLLGGASAGADWEARVTVNVPDIAMQSAQHYAMGIAAVKPGGAAERVVFMLSNESQPNPDGRTFYVIEFDAVGVPTYRGQVPTTAREAILRFRWDADGATLASDFSTDQGQTWMACGAPIPNPMGVTATDVLGIAVAGYSENMNISTSSNLSADSFWAVTQKPVIDSLTADGKLTWSDNLTDAHYTIEWASSVEGPWHRDWSTLTFVQSPTATKQVEVPRFFRVVRE